MGGEQPPGGGKAKGADTDEDSYAALQTLTRRAETQPQGLLRLQTLVDVVEKGMLRPK